jgi:hypothetical protein
VVGDLHISDLPAQLSRLTLSGYLNSLLEIRGSLLIKDLQYAGLVSYFNNLRAVWNIGIFNAPNVLDARIPTLQSINGEVTVEGCDRLCPARYPRVGIAPDDSECPSVFIEWYGRVLGDFHTEDLGFIDSTMHALVSYSALPLKVVVFFVFPLLTYCSGPGQPQVASSSVASAGHMSLWF